ncbi:DUF5694 domain-containing protein [uncultured Sphingomonas sp.]|uniref:DUF5694 domain-containing protein n=1 Tax=uncultured Sphingomonas sp. TaxID=158754 RepID=UPI002623DBBD|nr:DUF5694 domain-containing protein [uncultured Sphingomonas sp.]
MVIAMMVAISGGARAGGQDAVFAPPSARAGLAMPATKVMVLGISHLDNAPKAFDPAWLAPVMCRLHAYAPDAILIEAMSGEQLAQIDAYKAVHGDAGKWAGPTLSIAKDAQASLGLDGAAALAQTNTLAARPRPAPADRRRLAGLFLAAGEPFSAAVQWQQLAPGERIAADGVTDKMRRTIERFATGRGEITSMAVPLAVGLGLPRIFSAGDHLSDTALPDDAVFGAAVKAHPAIVDGLNKATPELQPYGSKALALDAPDRVMPMFRALNSPRFGQLDAKAQWLSLEQTAGFGPSGRQRVAAWEAQNLRMATTIREVTAPMPGGRALLIVGAAHKAFIEAYLRQMTDIEVMSVPAMLDATPAGC